MDPNALWKVLLETLEELNKEPNNPQTRRHAVDCLEALAMWLRAGGFPPKLKEK